MTEERAPYGPQIKFRTFIQYHVRDNNGDAIEKEKNLVIECSSGIEAAQAALSNLDSISGITTMQLFVSIDRTGK